MIDWSSIFDRAKPKPGATDRRVEQLVRGLGRPITHTEYDRIMASQRNPFPKADPMHRRWAPFDPSNWQMPDRPLPESYLSFVRYADGGEFWSGERLFQMWGTGLREFLLAYHVPQYMPRAVPFAFNGGGVAYLFDMREPPGPDGEYPILCAGSGNWDFDPFYSPLVADSFPGACRGRTNVEALRFRGRNG